MTTNNNNLKWLNDMNASLPGDTKTMRCKVCNEPVIVNKNYAILEVTCKACYAKSK